MPRSEGIERPGREEGEGVHGEASAPAAQGHQPLGLQCRFAQIALLKVPPVHHLPTSSRLFLEENPSVHMWDVWFYSPAVWLKASCLVMQIDMA